MKYDEEARLWKPSRRSFFFFGASAAVGAMLPAIVAPRLTATEASIRMNHALAKMKAAQAIHNQALERALWHGVREVMVSGRGGYLYPEGTGIFAPR